MQHRDMITIQKVISEMQIGIDMLGTTDLETFLANEMLKQTLRMEDVYMTVHEEYPVLMQQLQNILKKETE